MIADDPTTPGEIEARQVLDTFVRETDALVDLYVDGEVISTTGEHPFWVADKGWVEAKDLVVGSLLQTGDGRVVDVDKVEKREGKFPVYNFNVEGFHTYYVSDLGILVHNAGYGGLERGNINQNIAGGVPSGYEGHHLIPVKVAQEFTVMQQAADNLGYNINRGNNGIALPGTPAESLRTGLPYHGGRHTPEYNDLARGYLDNLQRRYDRGLVSDSDLVNEIANVESQIRSDLLDDRIRLQRNDPRP